MYNTEIHIPQQIEMLLSSVTEGNYPQFCDAVDNLKELMKERGFKTDIDSYIQTKKRKIDLENDNAMKIWKQTINGEKDFDAKWMLINDAETKRAEKVKTILVEHMGIMKTYVLAYISKVEPYGQVRVKQNMA